MAWAAGRLVASLARLGLWESGEDVERFIEMTRTLRDRGC